MKNLIKLLIVCLFLNFPVFAADNGSWLQNLPAQERIDNVGYRILNANQLKGRVIFSYNKRRKKSILPKEVFKRQVIVTDDDLAHCTTEDELAALIARKASLAIKSYNGAMGGTTGTLEVAFSPKKYEVIADKKAAEYLIKAGYNPLGLITYINKTYPQKKQDKISRHNLTSKRLMYVYEYIYRNAPYFLAWNTEYINNPSYQNFLLNSLENRKRLNKAIKNRDSYQVQYE